MDKDPAKETEKEQAEKSKENGREGQNVRGSVSRRRTRLLC